jgi:tetratricopeptide (TPR) repeat protein
MFPVQVPETKKITEATSHRQPWAPWIAAAGALLAVTAVYANHFHNSFHFDDFHTITQNPAIRSLGQVGRFFTDPRTFSILPSHQSYHPLVTASAALDYRLGGGMDPTWFHVSTFAWFLLQLALMYLLFVRILNFARPRRNNGYIALLAVSWYGLHPANAETINYIIQRADLYVTLGVVAGLAIFCYWPRGRQFGLYLAPVIAGALAKPVALVFPAILFCYLLLFDEADFRGLASVNRWNTARRSALLCLPAGAVCAAVAIFEAAMTPKVFDPGFTSRAQYWLTQPIATLHYFKSFFLPTELSADTDRQLVSSIFSETSVIGLAFLGGLALAIRHTLRARETRPIAFGLLWFLIASLPTALFPLAEAENDHRMFLPLVGLALAATLTATLLLERYTGDWLRSPRYRAVLAAGILAVLAAYAYGTHVRNTVWHSEESLWQDVARKSPRNGRGLMNYGLTQLSKGDIPAAYDYFRRASLLTPNYPTLEINLGVAAGALRHDAEAEEHFRRAISLAPQDSQSYFGYGRWLRERGRIPEAISNLTRSAALNSSDLDPRYVLMSIYGERSDWPNLKRVTEEVFRIAPNDAEALRYSKMERDADARVAAAERQAGTQPTPENYLTLSLQYFQSRRYEDCIRAATEALRLRPNYAEAYNNIAAGYQSLGRWDLSIEAAQTAIRLKPDFQLARNNLAYGLSQRALKGSGN